VGVILNVGTSVEAVERVEPEGWMILLVPNFPSIDKTSVPTRRGGSKPREGGVALRARSIDHRTVRSKVR